MDDFENFKESYKSFCKWEDDMWDLFKSCLNCSEFVEFYARSSKMLRIIDKKGKTFGLTAKDLTNNSERFIEIRNAESELMKLDDNSKEKTTHE